MPLKVKAEESGRERGMSRGGRESFGDVVRGSRAGEEGADGVRMSGVGASERLLGERSLTSVSGKRRSTFCSLAMGVAGLMRVIV